jgi:hypothetical protein
MGIKSSLADGVLLLPANAVVRKKKGKKKYQAAKGLLHGYLDAESWF